MRPLPLPGLPPVRPVHGRHASEPVPQPAPALRLVDPGQLELPPVLTGRGAVCEHCRQMIREAETASALLWVHPDGDTRCATGGYAVPAGAGGWSA